MCDIKKMNAIACDMFKNDGMIVSVGTRHAHTKHPERGDLTILLSGRVEFNSYVHRRDMVDVMFHYDLYVKRTIDGRYQSGKHGSSVYVIKDKPTTAISDAAFYLLV